MSNKYEFQLLTKNNLNLEEYNNVREQSVFVTLPWINFIEEDSWATALFVRITNRGNLYGYFTGLVTKKSFVKILGSPFGGWSTCFMGISANDSSDNINVYKQLIPFLYKATGCIYIEIIDRQVSLEDAQKNGLMCFEESTLELPIDMDDTALFKQMKTDCRNFIRQFERRGAKLEIAEPDDMFAEQYYLQLEDVFAKQGLVPTYSLDKVKCLLRNMKDSGSILCLRVLAPDDRCIATSIFFGHDNKCFFWGGASYRPDQSYRPNEYMIWSAIQYWRNQGCKIFDMVGVRDYKKKFGSSEVKYARLVFTKYKFLLKARDIAKVLYHKKIELEGKLSGKK